LLQPTLERVSAYAGFLTAVTDRIGEERFSALLLGAPVDEDACGSFSAKAAAEGGMVPFLKNRLEPTTAFSAASVTCCISGAVLAIGGVCGVCISPSLSRSRELSLAYKRLRSRIR